MATKTTNLRIDEDVYNKVSEIYKITKIPRSVIVNDVLRRAIVNDDILETIDKFLQSTYEERNK